MHLPESLSSYSTHNVKLPLGMYNCITRLESLSLPNPGITPRPRRVFEQSLQESRYLSQPTKQILVQMQPGLRRRELRTQLARDRAIP